MDLKTAAALHRDGRLAEAVAAYRQILAADASNGHATHLLGIVLGQLGRTDESLQFLEKASHLLPASPELLSNLAAMGRREGEAISTVSGGVQAARRRGAM